MRKLKPRKLSDGMVLIETRCVRCHHYIALPVREIDWHRWLHGVPVSQAFPSPFYTPGDRDFFTTKMCEDCQKRG